MKVKTTNRESIETIFTEALAIPSFTNTETEQGIEAYLEQRIAQIPYFREHPDHFGRYQVPQDHLHRSVNWALVDKGKKKTVILFHHHDTVDLASGEWKFGRGSCDMKAALALQLGVLEAYAADPLEGQVNLLYLSVGDEESYSRGMRGALGLLTDLQETFDLNYVLAVDQR